MPVIVIKRQDGYSAHRGEFMSNFEKPIGTDINLLSKESDVNIENDKKRAVALVKSVFDRIGVSPVAYNEHGKAYFHPELARELEKPGNEGIAELLKSRFSSTRNQ